MRLGLIAPCILIAWVAACSSQPAPVHSAGSSPKHAKWRPDSGTAMFECPETPTRNCEESGVDYCENACGDGDERSCMGLALWHAHGKGEGRNRVRAAELMSIACKLGLLESCQWLILGLQHEAKKRDIEAAYDTLEQACKRDPGCGCALYGSALTAHKERYTEGLGILDAACVRGAYSACDEADLMAELCARGEKSGVCEVLKSQGRVRRLTPEEAAEVVKWVKVNLPKQLVGCFRVVEDSSDLPILDSSELRTSAVGTLYCFANDRYFVRVPSGSWDQVQASWFSTPESTEFRNDMQDVGVTNLTIKAGKVFVRSSYRTGRLQRLAAREADAAYKAIKALPDVVQVCEQALRCAESSQYGYDGGVPVSLSACLALQREYADETKAHDSSGTCR